MDQNIKDDYSFSKVEFRKATPEEDNEQGIDGWICGIPFAYRKRKETHDDITIRYRRKGGSKTEYIKILDGTCRALLFFFDFPDKIFVCSKASIKRALANHRFKIMPNKDGETELAAIPLNCLRPLVWQKDLGCPREPQNSSRAFL